MSERGDEIWKEECRQGSRLNSPGQRIANRLAEAEMQTKCYTCGGDGTTEHGGPCACGGSGEVRDEVQYFRERLGRLRDIGMQVVVEIDRWEEAVRVVIGRTPNAKWRSIEELRAALAGEE